MSRDVDTVLLLVGYQLLTLLLVESMGELEWHVVGLNYIKLQAPQTMRTVFLELQSALHKYLLVVF